MAQLTGLPDFQACTSAGSVTMFAPFASGNYAVLPQQFVVAQDADGNPKFQLELIKRLGDFSNAGQYAVLDFALDGDFSLDDALTAVRSADANSTVVPISVNSGFARLYPTTDEVVPTADLLAPVPLGWTGSDYVRWTMRLSMTAGELMKGAVLGGSLLLGARIEFDVLGVAPRVPVAVEFDPTQLLPLLLSGRSTRQMAASDVLAVFTGPAQNYPLKVIGTPSGDFAEAVTSRIIAAYGSLVPSPGTTDPAYIAFKEPSQLEAGTVHWDLSQPGTGNRQWVLMLDPLVSLRAAAAKNGIDSLVKEVAISPLQIGFCNVDFTTNLPAHRVGVPALWVDVQVAANPPSRPSSINEQLTLTEPEDAGSVQFRLSPGEPLSFTLTGSAVVVAGQSEWQLPPDPPDPADPPVSRQCSDVWVQLTAGDFPVTFAHVTAVSRLTALAKLTMVLTYTFKGQVVQQQFMLTASAPDIAVGIPRAASNASLAITATPGDGSSALTLPLMTPGRITVDVTSFREYGPHIIPIQANFNGSTNPLFLDLLREDQAIDTTDVSGKVVLTADQPSTTWGYVAASPFHAGYRYRRSGTTDNPPAPWSPVLSPFTPLAVNADGTIFVAVNSGSQPASAQAVVSN